MILHLSGMLRFPPRAGRESGRSGSRAGRPSIVRPASRFDGGSRAVVELDRERVLGQVDGNGAADVGGTGARPSARRRRSLTFRPREAAVRRPTASPRTSSAPTNVPAPRRAAANRPFRKRAKRRPRLRGVLLSSKRSFERLADAASRRARPAGPSLLLLSLSPHRPSFVRHAAPCFRPPPARRPSSSRGQRRAPRTRPPRSLHTRTQPQTSRRLRRSRRTAAPCPRRAPPA
jgi:hypothetical protein